MALLLSPLGMTKVPNASLLAPPSFNPGGKMGRNRENCDGRGIQNSIKEGLPDGRRPE